MQNSHKNLIFFNVTLLFFIDTMKLQYNLHTRLKNMHACIQLKLFRYLQINIIFYDHLITEMF